MSLEAEERVNASTTNSNSTVEQSGLNRRQGGRFDVGARVTVQRETRGAGSAWMNWQANYKVLTFSCCWNGKVWKFGPRLPCYKKKMPCFNTVHFADESAGGKLVSGPVWGICDQARLKTAVMSFRLPLSQQFPLWYNQRIRTTLPCCWTDSLLI